MNAYELADDIKQGNMQNIGNAANVLRQQADRIAELEDKISFYEIKDLDSGLKTKPLSDQEIWSFADMVLENSDVIGFARAIEERHGIK